MRKWDWRREDSTYAAATIVTGAVVCFLIAGNFGLVPSPFGPRAVAGTPIVPALGVGARSRGVASVTALPTDTPSSIPTPSLSGSDGTPPEAVITSPGGTIVSATEGARVSGEATDAASGIEGVIVTFTPSSGEPTKVPAEVHCEDAGRRNCTWAADVPDVAGSYEVSAEATDRSGNASATDPSSMTVVNLGSVVEDLTSDAAGELASLLSGLLR